MKLPLEKNATDIYQLLSALREELSAYKTVSCGLMHEQVTELTKDINGQSGEEENMRVIRVGFCPPDVRRKSLGCAHSRANHMFAQLADEVHNLGVSKGNIMPSELINALVLKIYLLDHEKGLMEKQKAMAADGKDDVKVAAAEVALQDMLMAHRMATAELEIARLNILTNLDDALACYDKG